MLQLSVNQNGDTTISGNLDTQRITLNKPNSDSETLLKITNNNQSWELIALESTIAGDGCLHNFKQRSHQPYGILGYGIRTNMELDMVVRDFGFTIMVTQQSVEI